MAVTPAALQPAPASAPPFAPSPAPHWCTTSCYLLHHTGAHGHTGSLLVQCFFFFLFCLFVCFCFENNACRGRGCSHLSPRCFVSACTAILSTSLYALHCLLLHPTIFSAFHCTVPHGNAALHWSALLWPMRRILLAKNALQCTAASLNATNWHD